MISEPLICSASYWLFSSLYSCLLLFSPLLHLPSFFLSLSLSLSLFHLVFRSIVFHVHTYFIFFIFFLPILSCRIHHVFFCIHVALFLLTISSFLSSSFLSLSLQSPFFLLSLLSSFFLFFLLLFLFLFFFYCFILL